MPRKLSVPSYRLHRASGQAVVVLGGKSIYLGNWNTQESRSRYDRVVAEWLATWRQVPANDRPPSLSPERASDLRVSDLILAFFDHATKHYRHPDGRPTGELDNFRHALRPLRKLYGDTSAKEFGPLRLRAVREEMLKSGLCRGTINARVQRIRRAFRWAVSMEMIPATVIQALTTVASLQRGRCDARESKGVHPVKWDVVETTLPHLPRAVAAMVAVMRYSNCRAEDVVTMRPCDVITTGDTWEYRPQSHKNQWREESNSAHKRVVFLGPRCQAALAPFLNRPADAYLFSPRESMAEYQTQRAAKRRSKRTPSQMARTTKSRPKRGPSEHYSVNTFQQTIRKTCQKIDVPVWTVLQVRHSRATDIRAKYGVEGAAASLGNSIEAAQIYAQNNHSLACRIAADNG